MEAQTNKLIFRICLFSIAIHFLLLGSMNLHKTGKAWMYVYPYFDQNWSLFAPPPQKNFELLLFLEDKTIAELTAGSIQVNGKVIENNEMIKSAISNCMHFMNTPGHEKKSNSSILEKLIQNYLKHNSLPKAKKIVLIYTELNHQIMIDTSINRH